MLNNSKGPGYIFLNTIPENMGAEVVDLKKFIHSWDLDSLNLWYLVVNF